MALKSQIKRVKNVEGSIDVDSYSLTYKLLIFVTAITIAVLHRKHIAGMFESDRHFSHLSTLERELTFRTEMGLYYSYFKTITEAPTFLDGLERVMYDNVTEYPLVINTLKRFNLYPEVLLGAAFRVYEQTMHVLDIQTTLCYQVTRGHGLSAVQSCEGLGEKPYFYVEAVFLLNGISMAIFFLYGCYLSESYYGGLITVICFFFNHGECTRVQWTPPLRESFSYPFLVLQMLIVTHVIRTGQRGSRVVWCIALATASFMLPWQFAQFTLLMQTLSVTATYLLGFISIDTVKVVVAGQMGGLIISVIFLFGNEMLVTSFFSSSLIAIWVVLYLEGPLRKTKLPQIIISIVQGIVLLFLTFYIKVIASKLLSIDDDEHIRDIFRSKFSSFRNFHTLLYLCAPEFDFMESATPVRLSKTLLLPAAILVCLLITCKVLYPQLKHLLTFQSSSSSPSTSLPSSSLPSSSLPSSSLPSSSPSSSSSSTKSQRESNGAHKNGRAEPLHCPASSPFATDGSRSKEGAEMMYNLLQATSFSVMAVMIMRLKLFWTPHLCLLASLLASKKLLPSFIKSHNVHVSVLVAMVAMMSVGGLFNLQNQWSIQGEFSNAQMEGLIDWINENTPSTAVFGGPMPTMATVKLCTGRPIVNHPHYEDAGLRNRTVQVYSMFSRKSFSYVHQAYKQLHMQYFVVEEQWCLRRSKPGCGMTDLWDMEDKENLGNVVVCKALSEQKQNDFFEQVFKNEQYEVYRVK